MFGTAMITGGLIVGQAVVNDVIVGVLIDQENRRTLYTGEFGHAQIERIARLVVAKSMAHLVALTVTRVYLSDCHLIVVATALLKEGARLRELNVSDNDLTCVSMQTIAAMMGMDLEDLNISDNRIGADGMRVFGESFDDGIFQQLARLNVANNRNLHFPAEALKVLSSPKSSLKVLKVVGTNQYGARPLHARLIFLALSVGQTVEELSIGAFPSHMDWKKYVYGYPKLRVCGADDLEDTMPVELQALMAERDVDRMMMTVLLCSGAFSVGGFAWPALVLKELYGMVRALREPHVFVVD